MNTDPSTQGHVLRVEGRLRLSRRFTVEAWVAEENAKGHVCSCGCGRPVRVSAIHRQSGIPRYVPEHRPNRFGEEIVELHAKGLMTATDVATELRLRRTALRALADELIGDTPRVGARRVRVFSPEQVAKLRAAVAEKGDPRHDLSDAEWRRVARVLPPPRADGRGRPRVDERAVVNAILWVQRTGARWDALPDRYPTRQTCRFRLWEWMRDGTWARIGEAIGK